MADSVGLTVEHQIDLLRKLLPLVDRMWEFLDLMCARSWDVVVPRMDFEASFCREDEVELFRTKQIEVAKVIFSRPNGYFRAVEAGYRSKLIDHLCGERDQQLGRSFDPAIDPLWRSATTQFDRRRKLLQAEHRSEYNTRFQEVRNDEERRRLREVAFHASGIVKSFLKPADHISEIFVEAMRRYAEPLGFTSDESRSIVSRPVFSKRLAANFDLCLTPEPLLWYPGRLDGEALVLLSLQGPGKHGPFKEAKRYDRFLVIGFGELIPNFDLLYRRFATLDELEVVVKARLDLISILLTDIEVGLRTGLDELELS